MLAELGVVGDESLALLAQSATAGVQLAGPARHLLSVDHPGLVEVGHSAPLGVGAFEPPLETGQLGCHQLGVGSRALGGEGGLARGQQLGASEQLAHLVEHEGVQLVGPDAPLGATAVRSAGTHWVVVWAEVVAGHAVLAVCPVAGQPHPAAATAHQASQQERVRLGPPRAEGGVVAGRSLHRVEDVLGDDGGDGDLDPLGAVPAALANSPGRGVTLVGGAVPVQASDVGLVAQQPVKAGQGPDGLALGRGDPLPGQVQGDAADRGAGGELGEDAPHHGGLGLVHDHVRRAVGAAGHPPVAVGHLAGKHLAGPGPEQLAPPLPLGELRLLVLSDHPLDLHQQAGLGVVEGRGVGEAHRHLVAGQLVKDQHLVGVGPSQAVGRQAPHRVDGPCFRGVSQGVEAGAVQAGAGVAVVDELGHQLVALGRHPGPQRVELRADRAPGLLGLGRHPCVYAHPHVRLPFSVGAPPVAGRGVLNPS